MSDESRDAELADECLQITDEMVERAWDACIDLGLDRLGPPQEGRRSLYCPTHDEIRAVLEAALTPPAESLAPAPAQAAGKLTPPG